MSGFKILFTAEIASLGPNLRASIGEYRSGLMKPYELSLFRKGTGHPDNRLLPRRYETVSAAKSAAAVLFGAGIEWKSYAESESDSDTVVSLSFLFHSAGSTE